MTPLAAEDLERRGLVRSQKTLTLGRLLMAEENLSTHRSLPCVAAERR